jgi:phosphate transport system substrate-binding protein
VAVVASYLAAGQETWKQTEIARQPISIIVHPDNPVKNLTLDDLGNIYSGRAADWRQVTGPTMPIMVLSREAGASIRQRVDAALIGADGKLTPNAILLPSDEAMLATVSRRPEAIGYITGSSNSGSVRTLTVEGEHPSALARGRAYPFWQPIILMTDPHPSPGTTALLAYVKGRQGQRIVSSWGLGQGGSSP